MNEVTLIGIDLKFVLFGKNGSPEAVAIDKSGSNLAALHAMTASARRPPRFGKSCI
ncbi:hypothetical protein LMG29542_08220 [Paraburkholderia humisilvae]|uniref:Uncharacterized protein n=1 Tax=Paraburkholderia humisilvae TaxID=627669 RepID=A0A6J5F7F8_9BURK|nr:hypothetical protein LMG29542_08220 [Paraburkholderia humisilvae]